MQEEAHEVHRHHSGTVLSTAEEDSATLSDRAEVTTEGVSRTRKEVCAHPNEMTFSCFRSLDQTPKQKPAALGRRK